MELEHANKTRKSAFYGIFTDMALEYFEALNQSSSKILLLSHSRSLILFPKNVAAIFNTYLYDYATSLNGIFKAGLTSLEFISFIFVEAYSSNKSTFDSLLPS